MKVFIRTTDGNEWKGQLQEGWFEVEGLRCPAKEVKHLRLIRSPSHSPDYGDLWLADGTSLRVPLFRPGIFFWRELRYAITGQVMVALSSVSLAKTFAVADIEYFSTDDV
jgi:hypothetical protein